MIKIINDSKFDRQFWKRLYVSLNDQLNKKIGDELGWVILSTTDENQYFVIKRRFCEELSTQFRDEMSDQLGIELMSQQLEI